MFKRVLSAAVVFGAAALAPPSVEAQVSRCLPRADLVQQLQDKYKESLTGGGLQNAEQLIEVWTSPSGSFTVLVTQASGLSCIVATGQGWQSTLAAAIPGIAG